MDKYSKIALYSIGVIILLLMVAETVKPRPLNWRNSYSAADKIPLGGYVLFNELKNSYNTPINISNQSIFEFIGNQPNLENSTLLLINDVIGMEDQSAEALLKFLENGNTAFISTSFFYGKLADTLNIVIEQDETGFFKAPSKSTFTSPYLQKQAGMFTDVIENAFFTSVDTSQTTILGYTEFSEEAIKKANFIKTTIGNKGGAIYVHSNPFAFSNYHLLDDKADYAAAALSYLPKNHTLIWDNYYKSGRKVINSPLRFILSNPALKWAFYLSLCGLIIFVIFNGKRRQRIIPVVEPLKNTTVAFTQTIGDLYYQHGDYTNIINKKISYFLDFIRRNYYLNTNTLNTDFIQKLAVKSGNTVNDTKTLIDLITLLKSKSVHSENELLSLNKQIEHFTKKDI
ncbi:DUF4350 domain-containing protein [Bizionia sediminis]|uniref:DUF4350 domain-containing protein n=1 Tax=Bizionia sediminis TaxID=1737064 RepID=A0ABW5KQF4_9FLAO